MTKTIGILVGPDYEDLEVWYPKLRLEAAGYSAPLLGPEGVTFKGKHGYPAPVELDVGIVDPATLAGILAPGGWAPDKLRRDNTVLNLVRSVHSAGGLVATICHGPWVLISAGIVKGRRMTSTVGIRDDLRNAGALWVDQAVVEDANILSSRVPKDLPAFGEAMISWLRERSG
ncbi:MAG: type 1 glutamine amidotransferase [Gemmatimonadaceae bacterium]|nr:type 1 glutamine amidotransferase [Gemmatimonadaceae bacterium]